jgi:hypothetical protein
VALTHPGTFRIDYRKLRQRTICCIQRGACRAQNSTSFSESGPAWRTLHQNCSSVTDSCVSSNADAASKSQRSVRAVRKQSLNRIATKSISRCTAPIRVPAHSRVHPGRLAGFRVTASLPYIWPPSSVSIGSSSSRFSGQRTSRIARIPFGSATKPHSFS